MLSKQLHTLHQLKFLYSRISDCWVARPCAPEHQGPVPLFWALLLTSYYSVYWIKIRKIREKF